MKMISEEKKEEFAKLIMEEYDLRPSEARGYMDSFFRILDVKKDDCVYKPEYECIYGKDTIIPYEPKPIKTIMLSDIDTLMRDLNKELSDFEAMYGVEPKIYCNSDFNEKCKEVEATLPWYEDHNQIDSSKGKLCKFQGYDVEVCGWVKDGTVVLKG